MRFEAFVAARYLRGKRKNRFISLITLISVAGVSVGVIALIVVLSVMTGFQEALRETIIGNRSHLMVMDTFGTPFADPAAVRREIEEHCPEILASSPVTQIKGLIEHKTGSDSRLQEAGFILGIDPETETAVTQLAVNLTREGGRTFGTGRLPGDKEIVLGYTLAYNLRAGVGDVVAVYSPRQRVGPTGLAFRPVYLTVSGIAHTQMSEFDMYYGWVNMDTAEILTGFTGSEGVHAKLADPMAASLVAGAIERKFPNYRAVTWYESQQAFFDALKKEKFVMFIILTFIVLVAAFNISSTLIMVVMEKRRDIGILRTIGVSTRSVLLLFMIEGLFIGLGGTLIGVVGGWILAANINAVATGIADVFGIDLWDSTIYLFDRVPSKVVPADVATITISAVVLTFISTLYPAWSASRVDPVDALRHE